MRKHSGLLFAVFVSTTWCCAAAAVQGSGDRPDERALIAAASPAIAAANRDWLPAMRAHDVGRIVEPYADDALFVTPDGGTIRGRAAIAAFYRSRLTDRVRIGAGELDQEGIAAAGGLVYEWGRAGYRIDRGTGKLVESSGQYLTVWKRGRAGDWKIIRNLSF